ncbi:MAG: tRNA (adenosine(37)-N6)-threonylcarbamoyltransferase complex dimerization subunit type 1 TsaB [Oscillospiraceae bacterium]|nr:tRNA (adenosine(37)-N6)-threonylcarbamoyltransferase complex dimerization subunit type 1 TsaB [Oscillospiraceae bacterium]
MIILALESSAKAASVALSKDGSLLAQSYQFSGLTHSRTLLPMAEDLLKNAGLTMADVDCVAVAHGPGSFTGVRIGVSAAKGLCWGADKPAVGVSTLEAMAWNGEYAGDGTVICCAMDARRNQVYNALFTFENGAPKRLSKDRAISLRELCDELKDISAPIVVVGDGAELCYKFLAGELTNVSIAPESIRMQNAWGVCRSAEKAESAPASALLPVYLRLSQAERERLERMNK